MTTIAPVRRLAVALGTLAALAAGTALSTVGAAPADGSTDTVRAGRAAPTTDLTFAVANCEGCRIQLRHARETNDPQRPKVWVSREKQVRDGRVSFTLKSRRTWGMAVTVVAPWEGQTGYRTTVAFRYRGKSVGDAVTFRQARHKRYASACWAGTRRPAVTIPLIVREVMVDGVHDRVPGSIAFTPTTEDWTTPVRRARHGVLGSQDLNICGG